MARKADIRRVVGARFLSRAGSEAAFFIGLWGKAAFVMGAGAAALAGIMFAVVVASIAGTFIAGALVDRFGPRRVMIGAEVLFVPAALAMAFAETLPQLAVLASIWAFVGAPVVTAGASFAPFLALKDEDLKRVNARIEGAGALAFAVGPAVGALLVRYADVDWVFALDAATSLVAAVMVWSVHIVEPEKTEPAEGVRKRPFDELSKGVRVVYRSRALRFYVLAGTLVWLAFGSFGALEPLFFRDVVGTGIEAMGWVNALFGAGFMVGAALLPRLPEGMISARGLSLTVGLVGVGTVLYVGSADLRIIAFGAFVWSVVIGVLEPLLRTLLHRDSPRAVVGRVMGTAEIHRHVGELLPLAFAPALAGMFGVQAVMIGGGVLATLMALAGLKEAGAIDRERGVGADELQPASSSEEPISPVP